MAKNYLARYIWLIETINRHGHISFKEISDLWQRSSLNDCGDRLSNRTFFNHLESIKETFRIEIKCDRSLGYYISNSEDLEGDGIRQWLLESLSLNNLLNETKEMRESILFQKIPSSKRWLFTIVNAIKDGKAVEMTYQGFNRAEPHTFLAHPYCLKLFRQRWYMLARSVEYTEPRIYALDRIHDITESKIARKVPKRFNALEYFSNYFGIITETGRKLETIELKVYDNQVNYFESLPLHESQTLVEKTPDYAVFRYRIVPTLDFRQELLSRGPLVEVLSPKDFREEVVEDIKQMMALYA